MKIGKKKSKLKVKPTATAATAAKAAVVTASDDMFAMALPSMSVRAKKRRDHAEVDMIETVPAFENDDEKESLFRRVLEASKGGGQTGLIPADEHRAHMDELKRKKAERQANKAMRFKNHQKC